MSETKRKNAYISISFMVILSLITQILTIVKTSLVAGLFGIGGEMDAYSYAASVSTFLFGFAASGISTIIMPSYVKKTDKRGVNGFITILYSVILVAVLCMQVFRNPLIRALTGRPESFVRLSGVILIILLASGYLSSITSITVAFFQCEERFNIPKLITFFSHLFVVLFLLFSKELTIIQYALVISAGTVIDFVLNISMAVKLGWRFSPVFSLNSESKRLFRLFFPIVFSSGIYQLSLMIDSTIASRLDTGKITILSYSSQIASMVNSIIIGNLLTYCYPRIIKGVGKDGGQKEFWNMTSFFHMIICLLIAGFAAVGREGISFLFEHGKFSSAASTSVFIGALIYIFGQQTNIIRDMIYRYFYASGNTRTTAQNSLLVSAVNISSSIILVCFIGFYGIIFGTILASLVSLIRIMVQFGKKIGYEVRLRTILLSYLKNIIGLLVSVFVVYSTKALLPVAGNIPAILLFGTETVLVYAAYTWLFNRKPLYALK